MLAGMSCSQKQPSAALESVNRPHQTAGVVAQDKGCLQGCRVFKAALGCTCICQQHTSNCWWSGCPGQKMLAGMLCSWSSPRLHTNLLTSYDKAPVAQQCSNLSAIPIKAQVVRLPRTRMLAGMLCSHSNPSTGRIKLLVVWLPRTRDACREVVCTMREVWSSRTKEACRDVVLLKQPSAALPPVNKSQRGAGGATTHKSVSRPHQNAGGAVASGQGCLQGRRVFQTRLRKPPHCPT